MASRTTGAQFPATSPRFAKRPNFSAPSCTDSEDDEIGLLEDIPPHRFKDFKQNGKVFGIACVILGTFLAFFEHYLPFGISKNKLFVLLFLYRYMRLVVNTISWCLAKPWPRSSGSPLPHEASIIIPTAGANPRMRRCIDSALHSGAALVIVSTGRKYIAEIEAIQRTLAPEEQRRFRIVESRYLNKRWQHMAGLSLVETPYVVFKDDTVFWPSGKDFLRSALAPFEDPQIGGVGTRKLVERTTGFTNFMACLYLDRHNMETMSSNRIDGGVWVISGRTCIYRTEIIKSKEFLQAYLNEMIRGFCWNDPDKFKWEFKDLRYGDIGPLNADDDSFMTRWMMNQGRKLFFQTGDNATIRTNIDLDWLDFRAKLMRWIRGPWGRSNPRSAMEWRHAFKYPWTYFAVNVTYLFNFAVVWDLALLYSLGWLTEADFHPLIYQVILCLWIASSKLVKMIPHPRRHPSDVKHLPRYFSFAYYMSIIKLWAMITYSDTRWGSRTNVEDGPRDYVVTDDDLGITRD